MGYPGGKGRAYQILINEMPPHDVFVETHLGGGTIMRRKRPARLSIGIEADPGVIRRWQVDPPQHAKIMHGDAVSILPGLGLSTSDLVYSDPPYVSSSRRRPRCYRHDYTLHDHDRLLNVLDGLRCMVMVSGYRCSLYDDRLKDWRRIDYEVITQAGMRTESVWLNFAEGSLLHDYSFIGSTFRDRESKRRLRGGIVRRLMRLDAKVRNAIIADLAASDARPLRAALDGLPS